MSDRQSNTPRTPEGLNTDAARAFGEKNFALALDLLMKVLSNQGAKRGDIITALLLRGMTHNAMGNIEEGRLDWIAVVAIDPSNEQALGQLGSPSCSKTSPVTPHAAPAQVTPSRPILAPYEIWLAIAQHLSRDSLRSWLGVSRLHYAVAFPLVFQELQLHFGLVSGPMTPEVAIRARQLELQAAEILERISNDIKFAAYITTLILHLRSDQVANRLKGPLCKALPNLIALTSFNWIYGLPDLDWSITSELASSVPSLRHLSLSGDEFQARGLQQIGGLESVIIYNFDDSTLLQSEIIGLLRNNEATIRSLELLAPISMGKILAGASQTAIKNLHHLAMSSLTAREIDAFESFIPYANNLTSLYLIVDLGRNLAPAVVFRRYPHAFPGLRYLTVDINDQSPYDLGLFGAVGEFLSGRESLERLCLGDGSNGYRAWKAIGSSLTGLKVLCVRARDNISKRIVASHLSALPKGIEVMKIEGHGIDVPVREMAACFKSLRNLRALIITNQADISGLPSTEEHGTAHTLAKQAECMDLVGEFPDLDHVGVGTKVYKVIKTDHGKELERVVETGGPAGRLIAKKCHWNVDPVQWVMRDL